MKNKNLTYEIIRHISASLGAAPPPLWGKGLSSSQFIVEDSIKIEYEDNNVLNHAVYAAQAQCAENSYFKLLLVNLTVENHFEALIVTQFDSLPFYILRLSDELEESVKFLIKQGDKLSEAGITTQCSYLVGIENFISSGVSLEKLKDYKPLLEVAILMCD